MEDDEDSIRVYKGIAIFVIDQNNTLSRSLQINISCVCRPSLLSSTTTRLSPQISPIMKFNAISRLLSTALVAGTALADSENPLPNAWHVA